LHRRRVSLRTLGQTLERAGERHPGHRALAPLVAARAAGRRPTESELEDDVHGTPAAVARRIEDALRRRRLGPGTRGTAGSAPTRVGQGLARGTVAVGAVRLLRCSGDEGASNGC
jgi:hypothetical protein